MSKDNFLIGIIVAVLTASTTPWWWDRVFPGKTANATEATPAHPDGGTHVPNPSANEVPPPSASAAPSPSPIPPAPVAPDAAQCPEGKPWYLQMAAGDDRSGLIAVVDKVRAAGDEFRGTGLFESGDGKYRVALGCFSRFAADALQARFVAGQVLSKPTLVTQGRALTRRVY